MKRAAPALVTLLACTGASPPPENSCNISGWGSAPRTVVRAAPAPGAKVLAVLPHRPAQEGGQDINGSFPEFRITAARDGWFRIDQASYGDYGDPAPRRPLYSWQGLGSRRPDRRPALFRPAPCRPVAARPVAALWHGA